ncbi:MAG: transposase, partial [Plesiomonas sp.]
DMEVKSGKYEYRLIRRWFAEEKRFCIWMTNLPRETWPAERVMRLYRCRWQVELLFKEWQSYNSLKGFVTGQQAIAEGLVWAVDFLSKNTRRTKQRKSTENSTLEGVLIDVFS